MTERSFVVVGGSIAAVTAANAAHAADYPGRVVLVSDERHTPYSRVPLSKGFLAGTETAESIALPPLAADFEVLLGSRAERLDIRDSKLHLAGGEVVGFDKLMICTGARARHLAQPGQVGEFVVRTIDDIEAIKGRLPGVSSAVIVGAGFLGTEVGSTLCDRGIAVTIVTIDPPLVPQLGSWMADFLVQRAVDRGVTFQTVQSVEILGSPATGVRTDGELVHEADIVITAVGDIPNVEWLDGSGVRTSPGVLIDARGFVTENIGAAGDVAATSDGTRPRRSPNWTNAVVQAGTVARNLVTGEPSPIVPDPYHWTEQFGVDLKISGQMNCEGEPEVVTGEPESGSALVRWRHRDGTYTAAALNYRVPIVKLKRLGARALPLEVVGQAG